MIPEFEVQFFYKNFLSDAFHTMSMTELNGIIPRIGEHVVIDGTSGAVKNVTYILTDYKVEILFG